MGRRTGRAERCRAGPRPHEARWDMVFQRVAQGETVQEVCRDPRLPSQQAFNWWVAHDPDLQRRYEAAKTAAGRAARRREAHPYGEEVVEELLARIAAGRGMVEVCAEPDMPTTTSVMRWAREKPEFEARLAHAKEAQADVLFDLAWRIACEATETTVKTSRLMIQTIKWRVGKLAPRRYGTRAPTKAELEAWAREAEEPWAPLPIRRFARGPNRTVVDITAAVRVLPQDDVVRWVAQGWTPGEPPPGGQPPAKG